MKPFKEFFLEYRHDLADGTPNISVKANNKKDPNRVLSRKHSNTIAKEYKHKAEELHKIGTVLIGDKLLAIMAEYNIDFEDGKVAGIKNSPVGIQMSVNGQGQPMGRVIKVK